MTPSHVADLLALQLQGDVKGVVDLAAGDCSLLSAVKRKYPEISLSGCELDPIMIKRAEKSIASLKLIAGDGLTVSESLLGSLEKIVVIGNPPFTEFNPIENNREMLERVFPDLKSKLGRKRSEIYFLARSIELAKARNGTVVIVMPISFADGDIYSQYRKSLMQKYSLRKVIEIPSNTFGMTEARSVILVIDTLSPEPGFKTEILKYDPELKCPLKVSETIINPGDRFDARYHEGLMRRPAGVKTLEDVGATITRGRLSRKEAKSQNLNVVHTTDLNKADGELFLADRHSANLENSNAKDIAKEGDILLPRTGSRVNWCPVLVKVGEGRVTDHVFLIRVPQQSRDIVINAFRHPNFNDWLTSISKGVCARVLTKRELLSMPIFSLA